MSSDSSMIPEGILELFRCPVTGSPLRQDGDVLIAVQDETKRYPVEHGVPKLLAATDFSV